MEQQHTTAPPLIYGEVLFDCFEPDGPEVLGGAPFNVAWHLQGFGANPVMVSAIGQDAHGEQVLERMQAWGMDTRGIQQNSEYSTGQVRIHMQGSSHSFEILPDQAYDHIIDSTPLAISAELSPSLLYCGSLINRSSQSAATLQTLIATGLPLFVDINLRDPWWQHDDVQALMQQSRWLKLNDDEFTELTDQLVNDESLQALQARLALEWLVVTRGEAGASLAAVGGVHSESPPRIAQLVDTVGAGDAFSSIVILGVLRQWEPATILRRALEFAARICEQRGATAMNAALYQQYREAWQI